MSLENRRGAPREGAPLNSAILTGCVVQNSATSFHVEAPRAAIVLARRFAMPISTTATVAALAGYGEARHG